MNKKKGNNKAAKKPPYKAEDLIKHLDYIASVHDEKAEQVALHTGMGLIFPWQKHRLANLEFALARGGESAGFIIVRENADDSVYIQLHPLEESCREGAYWAQEALMNSADSVLEIVSCGPEEDDVNERFSDDHDFCPSCGRDKKAGAA